MRDIPADRTSAGSGSGRCWTATDRPFVTTSPLLIRTLRVSAVLKLHLRRLENSYLAEDSERDRETCNFSQRGESVYCSFLQRFEACQLARNSSPCPWYS